MVDVELGVKGDAFYSSYRGGCTVMWVGGYGLDMDAGVAVCMFWLSSGEHYSGGDCLSWPCGRRPASPKCVSAAARPCEASNAGLSLDDSEKRMRMRIARGRAGCCEIGHGGP